MAKIEKSNQKINPFGGLNFVIDQIDKLGLSQLVDNQLGERSKLAKYSFSDIIKSLWSVFFCGGNCAEDINEHLRRYLKDIPGLNIPNSDTILAVLKKLKTDNTKVTSINGNTYEININEKLNLLNLSILLKTNQLIENNYYDFDYDNEVLPTNKYDAKNTYKHTKGYFPGMATINGMPIYFENREGNMHVKQNQEEVLERCFNLLKTNKIFINRGRFDSGSYSKNIVDVVEKYSKKFYIRAMRCNTMYNQVRDIKEWNKAEINYIDYEVQSINYQPFGSEKTYRLVISREQSKNTQIDLLTNDTMVYRSILTNDWESDEKSIIEYYNQRGKEEKTIDILNNDFGWSNMPFSFMNENTVFLMLMMMCKNIFGCLIKSFSEKMPWLKENFRLKKFIFRFITVPVKWIKSGGQRILKMFTDKDYKLNI